MAGAASAQIAEPDDLSRTSYTPSPRAISFSWTDNSDNETFFNLQLSADGGTTWSALGQVGSGTTTFSGTLPAGNELLFFRVLATDGVDFSAPSNIISVEGTDPAIADTDGDEIPDGFEVLHGLDPYYDDAYEDADGDRYPNVFEYARGTDPNDPESFPPADYIAEAGATPAGNLFSNIQAALNQVAANHRVVLIRDGVYSGSGNVNLTVSGSHTVLLLGENGARDVALDGSGTARLLNTSGDLVLDGLTLRNGSATEGGAIYSAGGSLLVVNCVFSGNHAVQNGGAIYQEAGSTLVIHSTFLGNTAGDPGAAIFVEDGETGIAKSILWNSGSAAELATSGTAASISVTESIVRGGYSGTGNLNSDPLARFDGHLLSGSPAIDSGGILVTTLLDMDGEVRPQGSTTEIGADEWVDSDSDDLPDWWELDRFGSLSATGAGDADLDGLTNLAEYDADGDPQDYYDQGGTSITPTVAIVSGSGQTGSPSSFAATPLVVQVSSGTTNLVSAPVTFTVTGSGGGQIAINSSGTGLTNTLQVLTGTDGRAQVAFKYASAYATSGTVSAEANGVAVVFTATTEAFAQSGMKLWLKADAGVTKDGSDYVSGWSDQSGSGNHGSQGTSAARPQWVNNVFNGKPVLRFDGSNDFLTTGTNASLVSTNFTFIVVTAFNSTSGTPALLSRDVGPGATNKWIFWYNSGGLQFHIQPGNQSLNSTAFSRTNGQVNLFALAKSGTSYQYYRNGSSFGSATATVAIPSINSDFRIGQAEGSYFLNGDIAEVIAFDHALNISERQSVQSYLAAKYNITTDADGDGMSDAYELAQGLDPDIDDTMLDKDGDGVPNQWEYAKGTAANDEESFTPDWIVDPAHAGDSPSDNIVATIAVATGTVPVDNGDVSQSYKTILIRAGEYAESVTIPNNKRIALVGEKGLDPVKLLGGALNQPVMTVNGRSSIDSVWVARPYSAQLANTVTGVGMELYGSAGQQVRIANCIISHQNGGVSNNTNPPTGLTIEHCTIFKNKAGGIYSYNPTTSVKVKSSILWNPGVSDFSFNTGTANLTGNIVEGGSYGGTNSDPQLTANGKLRSGSPAIDTATGSTMAMDMQGEERPSGSAGDLGADEWVDSDADGLADNWEMKWFSDLAQGATGDGDEDELNNLGEYVAGANPGEEDSDGDGIDDFSEVNAGTNPSDPGDDSDGDGMTNGYETANGLNPFANDVMEDKDGDGVPNQWEFAKGTHPNDAESFTPDWIVDPAHAADSPSDNIVATIAIATGTVPSDNGDVSQSYKTILIKAGEYAETVTIPSNKRIALIGEKGANPVRLLGGAVNQPVIYVNGRSSYDGLHLTRPLAAQLANTVTSGGMELYASAGQQVRIANCIITDQSWAISNNTNPQTDLTVEHCTIVNNKSNGIFSYNPSIVKVKSSILWNPGATEFTFSSGTNSLAGNIVEGGTHGGTNLDPLVKKNGTLSPGSAAIDAATTSTMAIDIHGEARPSGGARDLGADEFIDSDSDGLIDVWEYKWFMDLDEIASGDSDHDGLTNLGELEAGTNPTVAGDGPGWVGKVSGDYQVGPSEQFLPDPLVVEVRSGSGGALVPNASVVFSVSSGSGVLATTFGGTVTSGTLTAITGTNGRAQVWYKQDSEGTSTISAQSGTSNTVNFTERTPLADGLWSRWKFDEGTGIVAAEETGLNVSGTLTNGAGWVTGFDGEDAVTFTGSNNYVTMGATANQGLDMGSDSFSVAMWVKYPQAPAGGSTMRIVSQGFSSWGPGYFVGLWQDGKLASGMGTVSGTQSQSVLFKTTGSYNDNKWHHVAVVYDRESSTGRIYVDGTASTLEKLVGTGGTVGSETLNFTGMSSLNASGTTVPFTVSSHNGASDFFKGSVDDLRIYRRALSAEDVVAAYNVDTDSGGSGDGMPDRWEYEHLGTLAQGASDDADLDGVTNLQEYEGGSDPQDYYDGNLPVLQKLSGDHQIAESGKVAASPLVLKVKTIGNRPLANAPVEFSISGTLGQIAISGTGPFGSTQSLVTGSNGLASVYLKLSGTIGALNQVQAEVTTGTASAWVTFSATTGQAAALSIISGNNQGGAPSRYLADPFVVEVRSGSGGALLINEPVLFTVASGSGGLAIDSTGTITSGTLTVNTGTNGRARAWYRQGSVLAVSSTISVSSGTTTPVQFTAETLPELWSNWPLNDGSGTIADEATGSGADGTLTNGPEWMEGFDGRGGLYFPGGTNSYVTMGTPSGRALDFGTGSFSVAMWVRYSEIPGGGQTRRIVGKGMGAWDPGYFIGLKSDGKLAVGLGSTSGTQANAILFKTSTSYDDGEWHHVTLNINRVGAVAEVFVDGQLQQIEKEPGTGGAVTDGVISLSGLATLNATDGAAPFTLGSFSGTAEFFDGAVDDIQIRRHVLTAEEIADIYNADTDNGGSGDGLPDWWEWKYLGTLAEDGDDDHDGDSLTNQEEYDLGSRPDLTDTDEDGVDDGDEVAAGGDPMSNETATKLEVFTPLE